MQTAVTSLIGFVCTLSEGFGGFDHKRMPRRGQPLAPLATKHSPAQFRSRARAYLLRISYTSRVSPISRQLHSLPHCQTIIPPPHPKRALPLLSPPPCARAQTLLPSTPPPTLGTPGATQIEASRESALPPPVAGEAAACATTAKTRTITSTTPEAAG